MSRLRILVAVLALVASAQAQSVSGTIEISKKLTKRSVTAAVPMYQRGTVVRLEKPVAEDPLQYERSRVVVYLEGVPAAPGPARSQNFTMQQLNREFSPDVLAVPVGATVSFPNMDPVFHNIFSLSKPKSFDLGSYDKGETRTVTFNKPGVVFVYCHLHPNMTGTIMVTPSKWFVRADREGHYRIADVPPGQYTLVAWHKAVGFFRKPVTITDGQDSVVNFLLPIVGDEDEKHAAMGSMSGPSGAK